MDKWTPSTVWEHYNRQLLEWSNHRLDRLQLWILLKLHPNYVKEGIRGIERGTLPRTYTFERENVMERAWCKAYESNDE